MELERKIFIMNEIRVQSVAMRYWIVSVHYFMMIHVAAKFLCLSLEKKHLQKSFSPTKVVSSEDPPMLKLKKGI